MITASLDRHVKLFRVDHDRNELQLDVEFKSYPISTSHLLGQTEEMIIGGRQRYFYSYNITSGDVKRYDGKRFKLIILRI